jgi:hypothetical protein
MLTRTYCTCRMHGKAGCTTKNVIEIVKPLSVTMSTQGFFAVKCESDIESGSGMGEIVDINVL